MGGLIDSPCKTWGAIQAQSLEFSWFYDTVAVCELEGGWMGPGKELSLFGVRVGARASGSSAPPLPSESSCA